MSYDFFFNPGWLKANHHASDPLVDLVQNAPLPMWN
jgi:hypothetical protein